MKKILSFLIALGLLISPALATQHDYDISNAPGAVVRADINDALESIATNNSGATAPSSTFSNMWWFDTSTSILKLRDNANTSWLNFAKIESGNWNFYSGGSLLGDLATLDTVSSTEIDNGAAVDTKLADMAAYTLKGRNAGTSGDPGDISISSLTEKISLHDDDLFLLADSEASNAFKKVKKSSISSNNFEIFTSSGTFTVPSGVDWVFLSGCGGGAGAGGSNSIKVGGASAGHFCMNVPYYVGGDSSIAVSIGAGGLGGSGNNDGNNGGTTSFGTFDLLGGNLTTKLESTGATVPVLPSISYDASNENAGDGGFESMIEQAGAGGDSTASFSGAGGGSPFGAGAAGSSNNSNGQDAPSGYCGAGSGANRATGGTYSGGDGRVGILIVSW